MKDIYKRHHKCIKCRHYDAHRDITCGYGIVCVRDADNVCPGFKDRENKEQK